MNKHKRTIVYSDDTVTVYQDAVTGGYIKTWWDGDTLRHHTYQGYTLDEAIGA